MKWLKIIATVVIFWSPLLRAQEIHHHEGQTAEVDRFYSTWMQPDYPTQSCCNKTDCYSPDKTEFKNGQWWFEHRETGRMFPVPAHKIEQNRDSPDGRNHVCANPQGYVYCFKIGGGT